MGPRGGDRELFIPAGSEREARSRIFALVGTEPNQARGPKRALVALARALALDVDLVATNAVLGRQIAQGLDVQWSPDAATATGQITLEGLNVLLEGAADAYHAGSLRLIDRRPPTLAAWITFRAARSKIEAVNRISALTHSGPEVLGPGSKEHKSVLTNLAAALFVDVDTSLSKTSLAAALAESLGVSWTDQCYSTGYSISLDGLNTILAGAERHLGRLGAGASEVFSSPHEEGAALAATLRARLPDHWDGRDCVHQMRRAEDPNWRQMEWPGFYNEFAGKTALNDAFASTEQAGPQRRFGQTDLDYALGWVWDLKAHTATRRSIPSGATTRGEATIILNDAAAARECIDLQGLGFLVIAGEATFDDDEAFDDWHRAYTREGRPAAATRANTTHRRRRKRAFTPSRCDAFWLENAPALDAAIAAGRVSIRSQGRQQARGPHLQGAPRRDKVHLDTTNAAHLRVSEQAWATTRSGGEGALGDGE